MLVPVRSTQFKRDVKRVEKRSKDLTKLRVLLALLNYSFENKPVEFSYFKEMIEEHYTNEKFGPFLTGLRFIRFSEGEMVAIRDRELLFTKDGVLEKHRFIDSSEIIDAVKEHFAQADYPIEDGLRCLGW